VTQGNRPVRPPYLTEPPAGSPAAGFQPTWCRFAPGAWNRLFRHPLAILLLLTCVIRGGLLFARFDQLRADPDAYRRLAETWLATGVYGNPIPLSHVLPRPTAFRPPLYPMLLAVTAWEERVPLTTVAAIHLACALLTVLTVFWLAHVALPTIATPASERYLGKLPFPRYGPFLAGLATIVDPLLLNQSTLVMTETLAAALVTSSLLFLTVWMQRYRSVTRRDQPTRSARAQKNERPTDMPIPRESERGGSLSTPLPSLTLRDLSLTILTGLLLGLSILCRPTFLPWSGLVLVLIGWHAWQDGRWPIRLAACGLAITVFLTILPWGLRNARVIGSFKLTTTHGGYTFYLANNPLYYQFLRGIADPQLDDSAEPTRLSSQPALDSRSDPASVGQPLRPEVWDAARFNAIWAEQRDACLAASQQTRSALPLQPDPFVPFDAPFAPHGDTAGPAEWIPRQPFRSARRTNGLETRTAKAQQAAPVDHPPVADAEVRADRCAYQLAWKAIRAEPTMFVWSCAVRITHFWRWLPHRVHDRESGVARIARYGVATWYAVQSGLIVLGLGKLRKRLHQPPWIFAVSLILVFTILHTFYWSDMRMRTPLIPALNLLATVGVATLAPLSNYCYHRFVTGCSAEPKGAGP
jgi:hypothetical protein